MCWLVYRLKSYCLVSRVLKEVDGLTKGPLWDLLSYCIIFYASDSIGTKPYCSLLTYQMFHVKNSLKVTRFDQFEQFDPHIQC